MFKCHMLLYVELNKIHVYMYSYGIDERLTIVRNDLTDYTVTGIENNNLDLSYRTRI